MIHRVVFSPRSRRDLEKIRDYIAAESANMETADRWIAQLLDTCERLRTLPERFPAYPYARPWKMMPCASYLVFFQIHENEVRIGHIRHAARRPFVGTAR